MKARSTQRQPKLRNMEKEDKIININGKLEGDEAPKNARTTINITLAAVVMTQTAPHS